MHLSFENKAFTYSLGPIICLYVLSAGEPQVLDYQTQQDKLFPLLAQAYAYNCVAQKIKQMLDEVMLQVKDGNYQGLIEVGKFVNYNVYFSFNFCVELNLWKSLHSGIITRQSSLCPSRERS